MTIYSHLLNPDATCIPGVTCSADVHIARYEWAASYLKDKRVIDLACGVGYGTDILSKVSTCIGVDNNPVHLEFAQENYPDSVFVYSDVTTLPFIDNTFDAAVSFETIEHFPYTDRFLAELKAVVKHKGKIFLSTPNRRYYSDKVGIGQGRSQGHTQEWYVEEFQNILKRHFNNFEVFFQSISGTDIVKEGVQDTQLYIIEVEK